MRYPQDPFTALVANVTAGGDSAARGMILGMVYGAAGVIEDLPQEWRENLSANDKIGSLLKPVHAK
jgi:ADP-ribosylglycohydrolase